jgi:hypothetical protein
MLPIESEQEEDGRWIAEVPALQALTQPPELKRWHYM